LNFKYGHENDKDYQINRQCNRIRPILPTCRHAFILGRLRGFSNNAMLPCRPPAFAVQLKIVLAISAGGGFCYAVALSGKDELTYSLIRELPETA
jgi:hypothetical protein